METLKKQILRNGAEKSTSSRQDSPASHSAMRDEERERTMTVTSGRKLAGLLERSDLPGLLVKTLLESPAWYSPAANLRWKVKELCSKRITRRLYLSRNTSLKQSAAILSRQDIPSGRLLFRLAPSERPTEGKGFSLLPTVQTQGLKVCENGKTAFVNARLLPTPSAMMPGDVDVQKLDARRKEVREEKKNGNGLGESLNELAIKGLLPTPTNSIVTYQDFVQAKYHSAKRPKYSEIRLLPAPQARDYKGKCHDTQKCLSNVFLPTPLAGDADKTTKASHQENLNKTFRTGGDFRLNPLFVGEMMGFPANWLVSPFLDGETKVSKPSGMQ